MITLKSLQLSINITLYRGIMKILITSIDLKKSQHNRPHQFVKYLSRKHEITVLSVNDWWKGDQGDLISYSSIFDDFLDNVDYRYLTDRKISPFLQEVFFTKKIKELTKEDFDVHLNYNSLVTGYRLSKHFVTVFDLADDLTEMIRESPQIPGVLRSIGGLMGDYYIKKDVAMAKYVTLTTSKIGEDYLVPPEKAKIVPNGVDIQDFKYYKNSKDRLGLDGFIVGYVGVLREWVDLRPVYKALQVLDPEIKLLVVGSEGRLEENKELARKYGVADRVIFTGMIPYSDVPKYISAMDVCLIPFNLSKVSHNALPLKLFEYMACEKPVISTEIDSLKSKFPKEILYAKNNEDYINTIKMVYDDEFLRKKLGKYGRKIAEKHNWEHITANLEEILLRAVSVE